MTLSIFYNPFQIVEITIFSAVHSKNNYLVAFKLQKSVCTHRNEMPKASLALHESRSPGLELHAEEPPVPPGYSPKIVLHRVPITDANTPTSSPVRVSTTVSRPPADHQVHAVIYDQIIVLLSL